MQCVKLRSVMGSYLNIHLNLFPIYVLLLLLTLSHGRPSAKVRETREDVTKSQRQQFKGKWYQLSNLSPASNLDNIVINSVSNEYNSVFHGTSQPISHLMDAPGRVSTTAIFAVMKGTNAEKSRVVTKTTRGATGSHSNGGAMERNRLLSHENDDDSMKNPMERQEQYEVEEGNSGGAYSFAAGLPKIDEIKQSSPQAELISNGNAVDSTAAAVFPANSVVDNDLHQTNNRSLKWNRNGNQSFSDDITARDPSSSSSSMHHSYTINDNEEEAGNIDRDHDDDGGIIVIDHGATQHQQSAFHKRDEKQAVDFVENDITSTNNAAEQSAGSQQQLVTFRQNILRSLGHHEAALQTNFSPTNVTLDYNDEDTLTKYNITKEEYLQAYEEYMKNVRNRRLANRGLVGVKDRRKNAVTIAKTYHDNGTDLFSIGTRVLKLFRFDLDYAPTKQGTDVRIQRVVLSMPAMCQLTGDLRNSTDLPDLQELSELASLDDCSDESDPEKENMNQIDLTRNLTSWSVRNRKSSPFIVMAICSRESIPKEPLDSRQQQTTHQQRHHRHSGHHHYHGSTLKVVAKEFMKPTMEAQLKRRDRRAAPTEPSTLRSFTHKRDNGRGRECANTRHGKTCCRRSLKIKFSDLGISDVILEPKEFDAHVCDGRCNARRVSYASTHAMFQHILHQTKGKKFAPRPCCVPTALTELDVLHLDPKGNRNGGPKLIVTILKDAIVKECGCS